MARSVMCVVQSCWYALVKMDILPLYSQLLRGDSGVLGIAPDNPTVKSPLCSLMSLFYINRIQNDDLPEPLGPLIMHVNGCLILRSSLKDNL